MDPKIEQIGPWSAKGSKKCHRLFDNAKFPGGRGPQDQLEVGPFDHLTVHKGSRHAVGPKARRICIYYIRVAGPCGGRSGVWVCILFCLKGMNFRLITCRAPRGTKRGHGWSWVAKKTPAAIGRPQEAPGGPRRPQPSPGAPRWLQNKCSNLS